MKNYIDLDFVLDLNDNNDIQLFNNEMKNAKLTYEIIKEIGPAGGNPLIRIIGHKNDIEKYMIEEMEMDFYINEIQPL